jgi:hypothetical protein
VCKRNKRQAEKKQENKKKRKTEIGKEKQWKIFIKGGNEIRRENYTGNRIL